MESCFSFVRCAVLFVSFWLVACATPTISNVITLRPAGHVFHLNDPSVLDSYLIGGGGLDWGESAIPSENGSIFLFGHTRKSFGESTDLLAARLSSDHKLLWANTYGGSHKDYLKRAIKTRDDGFLLLGGSQSLFFTPLPGDKPERPLLVKLDENGHVLWAVTLDREWEKVPILQQKETIDQLLSVIQTSDGGYACVGNSGFISNDNPMDLVILKIDENGEALWQHRYDIGRGDIGWGLKEGHDGTMLAVGGTSKTGLKSNLLLLKIDSTGRPLWAKSYASGQNQLAFDMLITATEEIVVSGIDYIGKQESKIACTKFSPAGEIIWSRTYGTEDKARPLSIVAGPQGQYLVVGRSGNEQTNMTDGVALLLSGDGDLLAHHYFGGKLNDELNSAFPMERERYYLLGSTDSFEPTYANLMAIVWEPEFDPAHQDPKFLQTPLPLSAASETATYFPVNFHISRLPVGEKGRGLEVKSLSIINVPKE